MSAAFQFIFLGVEGWSTASQRLLRAYFRALLERPEVAVRRSPRTSGLPAHDGQQWRVQTEYRKPPELLLDAMLGSFVKALDETRR